MSETTLDFTDTITAFADKTDSELKEKFRLFRMLNSPTLNSFGKRAAKFALSWGLPVEGLIKGTIFSQFCGGETIEESQKTIEKLARARIGTVLDYSVEGHSTEGEFDATRDEIICTINRAKDDPHIPFSVFKVTGIAPLGTLERMSQRKKLDAKSQMKCERIHARIEEICAAAYSIGQPIFIDAEETWIQDAIDRMTTAMMEKYNRERPVIFNTLQLYRKGRLQFLKESYKLAKKSGYFLGVKLVRGAYMEKERDRALEKGYESPIHPSKEATGADYDAALLYCLDHFKEISFVAATHNEKSTSLLVDEMRARKIKSNHPNIHFSQLYGMSDNLSYVLGKNGYNVTKYVPYGPVRHAVPYLIRRAEENSSVTGQMSRELEMISAEMRRRGIS